MKDQAQKKMTADEAFDRDVPADMRDDVMQRICEAAWGGDDPGVKILDAEQINVVNVEVSGTIDICGREFWFHLRDGNNNGTELVGWEDGPGIRREARERKTLAPLPGDVSHAISTGASESFLKRWDDALDPSTELGRKMSDLPFASSYDAFFSAGPGASQSHNRKAREEGFQIVDESEAVTLRRGLVRDTVRIIPASFPLPLKDPQIASEALRAWDEARDPDTAVGAEVERVITEASDRMARAVPGSPGARSLSHEEHSALNAAGYRTAGKKAAGYAERALIFRLLSASPIEGFDAANLPKSPMREMFHALDPALAPDVRVDPAHEVSKLLESLSGSMARDKLREVPDAYREAAARVGYEIVWACLTEPKPADPVPGF